MSDFSSTNGMAGFFSVFWNQIFKDSEFTVGLAAGQAAQVRQMYVDFVQSMDRVSIGTVPVYDRELLVPLVISEEDFFSGLPLKYGDGAVWGPQPAGGEFQEGATFLFGGTARRSATYYYPLPSDIANVGNSLLNRLHDPSVVMVKNSEFIYSDGLLIFRDNPFENDLIPKLEIPGKNTALTRQITLWLTNVDVDRKAAYLHHTYPFSNYSVSSEQLNVAGKFLYKLFSYGPSLNTIDSFVATMLLQPVILEAQETVQSVNDFNGGVLVVTDQNVYSVDSRDVLRDYVTEGTTLQGGRPLTNITEVSDAQTNLQWWQSASIINFGSNYFVAPVTEIGIGNASVDVEIGQTVDPGDPAGFHTSFKLYGKQRDIDAFWSRIRQWEKENGQYLSTAIWKKAGAVDINGDPDFSQTDIKVNPLQLMVEEMLGTNTILIKVVIESLAAVQNFITNLRMLKLAIPAPNSFIIVLNLNQSDDSSFYNESDTQITSLPFEDTALVIAGDADSFSNDTKQYWQADGNGNYLTKTAEAISMDLSPDLLTESLDFSNNSVVSENIQVKAEEEV
jgi:hypothetical protein